MKIRNDNLIIPILVFLCLLGIAIHAVQAQAGDGFDLTWNTLESGGRAGGGSYSLYGSFGQADAGASLEGSGYSLAGGFWSGIPPFSIHLPVVVK